MGACTGFGGLSWGCYWPIEIVFDSYQVPDFFFFLFQECPYGIMISLYNQICVPLSQQNHDSIIIIVDTPLSQWNLESVVIFVHIRIES